MPKLTKGLPQHHSDIAVKAFKDGLPGVYGVAECLDEVLEALAQQGWRLVKVEI